jgi:hypothetical protein
MKLQIKNKNLFKIIFDIIMSVLLVLMFNKNVISLDFHEIGGLFLCGFFIIHNLINWKWIVVISKKIFSRDLAFKLRFGYIIDFLLLLSVAAILVSGILISKVVFTGLSIPGGNWKVLHYFASALSLILVGIHVGLHWGFVMTMFKKYVKVPAALAKPVSIILVIAVLAFGLYSIYSSNFKMWLSSPFTNSQMEGGRAPMNFDSQSSSSNSGTDNAAPAQDSSSNSSSNPSDNSSTANNSSAQQADNNKAADNIDQNQQNQNGTRPAKPDEGNGTGKGRPNGDGFSKNGDNMPPNGKGFPDGEPGEHGKGGNSSNILNVILTFISIIGVFAAITYYCEKLLRKRKSSQLIINN